MGSVVLAAAWVSKIHRAEPVGCEAGRSSGGLGEATVI